MKANSRRRVLISSVAMLLVALVALSTSTYAWFTNSSTAKAKNVEVSTSKLSNLQVCKTNSDKDSDWGNEVDLDAAGKVLVPSSTGNLTNWFNTTALSEDSWERDTTKGITDVTGNEGYVIVRNFFIRSKDVDAANVKWSLDLTGTDDVAKKYLRVALVGGDGDVIWSNDGVTTAGLTKTDGTTVDLDTSDEVTGTLFANLTKDTAKELILYAWFEGQDAECYNANAGYEANIVVNFSKGA